MSIHLAHEGSTRAGFDIYRIDALNETDEALGYAAIGALFHVPAGRPVNEGRPIIRIAVPSLTPGSSMDEIGFCALGFRCTFMRRV
jgi:hypothetical protein